MPQNTNKGYVKFPSWPNSKDILKGQGFSNLERKRYYLYRMRRKRYKEQENVATYMNFPI